jgi:hypothetical protein
MMTGRVDHVNRCEAPRESLNVSIRTSTANLGGEPAARPLRALLPTCCSTHTTWWRAGSTQRHGRRWRGGRAPARVDGLGVERHQLQRAEGRQRHEAHPYRRQRQRGAGRAARDHGPQRRGQDLAAQRARAAQPDGDGRDPAERQAVAGVVQHADGVHAPGRDVHAGPDRAGAPAVPGEVPAAGDGRRAAQRPDRERHRADGPRAPERPADRRRRRRRPAHLQERAQAPELRDGDSHAALAAARRRADHRPGLVHGGDRGERPQEAGDRRGKNR